MPFISDSKFSGQSREKNSRGILAATNLPFTNGGRCYKHLPSDCSDKSSTFVKKETLESLGVPKLYLDGSKETVHLRKRDKRITNGFEYDKLSEHNETLTLTDSNSFREKPALPPVQKHLQTELWIKEHHQTLGQVVVDDNASSIVVSTSINQEEEEANGWEVGSTTSSTRDFLTRFMDERLSVCQSTSSESTATVKQVAKRNGRLSLLSIESQASTLGADAGQHMTSCLQNGVPLLAGSVCSTLEGEEESRRSSTGSVKNSIVKQPVPTTPPPIRVKETRSHSLKLNYGTSGGSSFSPFVTTESGCLAPRTPPEDSMIPERILRQYDSLSRRRRRKDDSLGPKDSGGPKDLPGPKQRSFSLVAQSNQPLLSPEGSFSNLPARESILHQISQSSHLKMMQELVAKNRSKQLHGGSANGSRRNSQGDTDASTWSHELSGNDVADIPGLYPIYLGKHLAESVETDGQQYDACVVDGFSTNFPPLPKGGFKFWKPKKDSGSTTFSSETSLLKDTTSPASCCLDLNDVRDEVLKSARQRRAIRIQTLANSSASGPESVLEHPALVGMTQPPPHSQSKSTKIPGKDSGISWSQRNLVTLDCRLPNTENEEEIRPDTSQSITNLSKTQLLKIQNRNQSRIEERIQTISNNHLSRTLPKPLTENHFNSRSINHSSEEVTFDPAHSSELSEGYCSGFHRVGDHIEPCAQPNNCQFNAPPLSVPLISDELNNGIPEKSSLPNRTVSLRNSKDRFQESPQKERVDELDSGTQKNLVSMNSMDGVDKCETWADLENATLNPAKSYEFLLDW